MISQLIAIALATLVTEDLTCIATGVLVAQGKLSLVAGTTACVAGIVAGDMLLFLLGRIAGQPLLRWRPVARFLPQRSLERASAWIKERGLAVVFLSRFTPGLRLPTYVAAGILRTRTASFLTYFLIAATVWTPILVGGTALLGDEILRPWFDHRAGSVLAMAMVSALLCAGVELTRRLIRHRRKLSWEFWPVWLAYLPVIPYILCLGLRRRSLTLFTAANPGIPSSGLQGESKSDILRHLSNVEGAVADYAVIAAALDLPARIRAARRFMEVHAPAYPVVLKPDVGERGSGVAVIRSDAEMSSYLASASGDTIIQRYVAGAEFGVFYYRFPNESRGRIFSITEKRFPEVTGDGRSTVEDLILADSRAACMRNAYRKACRRAMTDVPAPGERVPLAELGSHCRGAVFLDGRRIRTAALEAAIDRISKAHPGFFIGRYDIRTPSIDDLREGRNFQVIELNGVAAEATHIYDPSISVWEAYRVIYRQWRIAFEIGAQNRARGFEPMTLAALLLCVRGAQRPAMAQTRSAGFPASAARPAPSQR